MTSSSATPNFLLTLYFASTNSLGTASIPPHRHIYHFSRSHRWNTSMLRFETFQDAEEIHKIELAALRTLEFKVAVDFEQFQLYDGAMLKPLLIAMKDERRPFKKRKSITVTSDEEYHAIGKDTGEFEETATTCSIFTPTKASEVPDAATPVGEIPRTVRSAADISDFACGASQGTGDAARNSTSISGASE